MNICPKCNEEKSRYQPQRRACRECVLADATARRKSSVGKRITCIKCGENAASYKANQCRNCYLTHLRAYWINLRGSNIICVSCGDYTVSYNGNQCRECVLAKGSIYRYNAREQIAEYGKRYREQNPEKIAIKVARRRLMEKQVIGVGLYVGWKKEQYAYQDGICVGCNRLFDIIRLTIDHIIPIFKGGLTQPDNCQLMCGQCNSSKGIKTMGEWIIWR